GYSLLAKYNANDIARRDISGILSYINHEWPVAWDDANENNTYASDIEAIREKLATANPGTEDIFGKNKEDVYQDKLNLLMSIIDEHMRIKLNGKSRLQWKDTHANTMSNGRKPDGVLAIRNSGAACEWTDVAVSFEVKSDRYGPNALDLRGQVLTNFLDMAYDQPRRYSIAFGISQGGGVNVYLCTLRKVYYNYIGSIPCDGSADDDIDNFIRFLLVLYVELPKDHFGFLMKDDQGIYKPFCFGDISGFDQPNQESSQEGILRTAKVSVIGDKAFSGRRHIYIGSRSWLYDAQVHPNDMSKVKECILKLNWCTSDMAEASVHKRAMDMRVPYTPCLIDSATIPIDACNEYVGEVLLIERCGQRVSAFLTSSHKNRVHRIVDIFAGYLHTLLVAADGDEDGYILHRDISAGNLLVKDDKHPYIIDWGCGLVAKKNQSRTPSTNAIIGTAPFMGIRVLYRTSYRSLLEDLESLFLVLSLCLWNKFGDGQSKSRDDNFEKMWRGTLTTEDIIESRAQWLHSHDSYWSTMKIKDCPDCLTELATGMYDLLFPEGGTFIRKHACKDIDPRITQFKAKNWTKIFRTAADLAIDDGYAGFDHVDSLCKYVRDNPSCALVSMGQRMLPETLTMQGRKRGASDEGFEEQESKARKLS
ncbi:hypothetical protein GGI22_002244, partial [Coemansia erecta]